MLHHDEFVNVGEGGGGKWKGLGVKVLQFGSFVIRRASLAFNYFIV